MKKLRNVLCLVMVFAMLLCSLSACAGKSSTDASDEITIAFIGNTTGDYAQYGIPVRNAVMMYFDQLNSSGGINGKKVKVLEYDDKGDGVEAVNAFNLAMEKGITAVIGWASPSWRTPARSVTTCSAPASSTRSRARRWRITPSTG